MLIVINLNIKAVTRKIKRTFLNQNKQLEKKFKNEKWMQIILKCQNEMLKNEPSNYYITHYRNFEKCYWINIPQWLFKEQKNISGKILDIGCGYGTLSFFCQKILKAENYCIDFNSLNMNKELIKEKKILFKINNIEIDDFPWNEKFDVILFTEVLEHLNFHPVSTLKKIHNLLKPKGKLFLSTPDASEWGRITKYFKNFDDIPYPKNTSEIIDDHIFQYNKEELLRILADSGFNVLKFAYSPGVINRHFNLMLERK